MTNEEIANIVREEATKQGLDGNTAYLSAMAASRIKDEQFAKEKQQWIEKACVAHCNNCYTRYGNCQEESYRMQCQRYVNFKKAMEEL